MNPSIEDRLGSMIRAMEEVVLPELRGRKGLAEEQASLVLGHLHQLRAQAGLNTHYENAEFRALATLAAELVAAASGGPVTTSAAHELRSAAMPATDDDALQAATVRTSAAIAALIAAAHVDGDTRFRTAVYRQVLGHGAATALRDRSWFAITGFEGPDTELPSMTAALT